VGLLATALLVTNNLRDIPGDTAVGKRTLAVRLGDQRTRWLYVALVVGAFVSVPFVAGLGGRPAAAAALIAVLLAQKPVVAVLSGANGPALVPVLAATARVQLAFGVLFATGLALSA
jgi:1,4-dihydroxy-2-naphthoate octaprenyltransferase